MRKIVFYGNCQAATMCRIFTESLAPLSGDTAVFLPCYNPSGLEAGKALLADADIVVAQIFDLEQIVNVSPEETTGRFIPFPTLSAGFLWPFGAVAHIRNRSLPYWICGPYDYLMGDGFLNRRIEENLSPEEALAAYQNLDIGRVAHLDRIFEIAMERLQLRDEDCGTCFAQEIKARFRSESLFLNTYHPGLRIASQLARHLFLSLGIAASDVDRLIGRWKDTPFERFALPIHPGVARHFGLDYVTPGCKYLYHTGEMLTFEEFCLRYVAYQWNESLLRGVGTNSPAGAEIHAQFRGNVSAEACEEAIGWLKDGLAKSNGSAQGSRALAVLLEKQDRLGEAVAALEDAVAFDPADTPSLEHLASLYFTMGRAEDAERALEQAIDQDPACHTAYVQLATLLTARQDHAGAAERLRVATELRPGNGDLFYHWGLALNRSGNGAEAERAFRKCIALLPQLVPPKIELALLLSRSGRTDEAADLRIQAIGLAPDDESIRHRFEPMVPMVEPV